MFTFIFITKNQEDPSIKMFFKIEHRFKSLNMQQTGHACKILIKMYVTIWSYGWDLKLNVKENCVHVPHYTVSVIRTLWDVSIQALRHPFNQNDPDSEIMI
jgi:hypothetical protein